MKRKPKVVIKVEDVYLEGGRRAIDKFREEMVNEPAVVKPPPEEAFRKMRNEARGFVARELRQEKFPGLDSLINAVPTRQPWESTVFMGRHFETDFEFAKRFVHVLAYRLSNKPFIVAVMMGKETGKDWYGYEVKFYRRVWRLWWRKVDPMKDAKLRAILEGAVALDALAGREP